MFRIYTPTAILLHIQIYILSCMESSIYDHVIHILRGHCHRCDLVIRYVIRTVIESLINGNPIFFLTDILSFSESDGKFCRR